MNKLFLILLPITIDRDAVIANLKTNNVITFWFYSFPSSFFARSPYSAAQIQQYILKSFPMEMIFIIQINSTTDLSGTVPDDHAPLFNNR